ncbi:TIGR00730 family Rossman fold protein [Streptomyces nanshensis]|uniref:LOG family protein n=1 Tax=Streptomyces nanshensis TaxID=518642 RepID=UPI00085C41C0|nr:TIGR00730 family Rossman fold protein [Streptomyces nanshensis]
MSALHERPPTVGVFCSACPHPEYEPLAEDTGRQIASRGAEVIYGGGTTGCMGALARGAHAAGGTVTGITPLFLHDPRSRPAWNQFLTNGMHARKDRIYEPCVGFLALPGGPGTMDELFEVAVWSKHRIHRPPRPFRPLVLVNWGGYWDGLLQQLGRTVTEGLLADDTRADLFRVAGTTSEALDKLGIPSAHHRRPAAVAQTPAIKPMAAPHTKRKA